MLGEHVRCAGTSGVSLHVGDWPFTDQDPHVVAQVSYVEDGNVRTVLLNRSGVERAIALMQATLVDRRKGAAA